MRDLISRFRTFFTTKVGRCGTCMRQSLASAVTAWGVFGVGLLMWPSNPLQHLIGFLALGLTALWMLHVAIYAIRGVTEAGSRNAQPLGRGLANAALVPTRQAVDNVGRRHALRDLLRTAGVGVVVSVPALLWPSVGFAFCGQCTVNRDCGVGFVCKNTAPVNSGKVCNECVKS